MARISVDKRIERYVYGLNPDRVREYFAAHKDEMITSASQAFNDLATIEDRVKGVLGEETVPTVQYIWYHDFARVVYRLQTRFSGGRGLRYEVGSYIQLWVRRGADEDVLKKVSLDVFAIDPL
jgi:hypothetical protein